MFDVGVARLVAFIGIRRQRSSLRCCYDRCCTAYFSCVLYSHFIPLALSLSAIILFAPFRGHRCRVLCVSETAIYSHGMNSYKCMAFGCGWNRFGKLPETIRNWAKNYLLKQNDLIILNKIERREKTFREMNRIEWGEGISVTWIIEGKEQKVTTITSPNSWEKYTLHTKPHRFCELDSFIMYAHTHSTGKTETNCFF